MTQEQATAQISLLLQPDCEPSLTTAEVSAIVDWSARPDSAGNLPTDDAWTPTYDVYAGVSLGWKIKAAKAAGNYQFRDDALELRRDQIHAQCMKMAAEYSSMTGDTVAAIQIESPRETALRRAEISATVYEILGVYDLDDI